MLAWMMVDLLSVFYSQRPVFYEEFFGYWYPSVIILPLLCIGANHCHLFLFYSKALPPPLINVRSSSR